MLYTNNVVYQSTDENQYRIQSATLAMVAAAYVVTLHLPLLLLLCYDFAVRAFISDKLSPFYHLSQLLVRVSNIAPYRVNASPKRFATKIWLILTLVTLYASLSNSDIVALLLATALTLCVTADALMNVCVGCRLFAFMKRHNITIDSLKE